MFSSTSEKLAHRLHIWMGLRTVRPVSAPIRIGWGCAQSVLSMRRSELDGVAHSSSCQCADPNWTVAKQRLPILEATHRQTLHANPVEIGGNTTRADWLLPASCAPVSIGVCPIFLFLTLLHLRLGLTSRLRWHQTGCCRQRNPLLTLYELFAEGND